MNSLQLLASSKSGRMTFRLVKLPLSGRMIQANSTLMDKIRNNEVLWSQFHIHICKMPKLSGNYKANQRWKQQAHKFLRQPNLFTHSLCQWLSLIWTNSIQWIKVPIHIIKKCWQVARMPTSHQWTQMTCSFICKGKIRVRPRVQVLDDLEEMQDMLQMLVILWLHHVPIREIWAIQIATMQLQPKVLWFIVRTSLPKLTASPILKALHPRWAHVSSLISNTNSSNRIWANWIS